MSFRNLMRYALPILVTMTPAPCERASSIMISPIVLPFSSSRWLIGSSANKKSKRLHQSPDHGHPLLLAETHAAYRTCNLSPMPNASNQASICFFLLESRQVVFNRHVLVSRQLGETNGVPETNDSTNVSAAPPNPSPYNCGCSSRQS